MNQEQRLLAITQCCSIMEEIRYQRLKDKLAHNTAGMIICEIGECDQLEELHRLIHEQHN